MDPAWLAEQILNDLNDSNPEDMLKHSICHIFVIMYLLLILCCYNSRMLCLLSRNLRTSNNSTSLALKTLQKGEISGEVTELQVLNVL